jgi:DNA-binding Lrp family transcriptional regulator
MRKLAKVRALHSVSGEFDMIAVVVTPTVGDMDTLIDRIGALEGVERTTSSIILATKFQR